MEKFQIQNKKYKTIITILLTAFLSLTIVDKLTKRNLLTLDEAILLVEENNGTVDITFKEEVAGFENVLYDYENDSYSILAWQTPLHKILGSKSLKNLALDTSNVDYIYYVGVKKDSDTVLYGFNNNSSITLPRLALNYYLTFATGLVILFGFFKSIFKNSKTFNKLASNICLINIAYILSHFLVMMSKTSTYFIERDFTYIIVKTIILSSILIILFKHFKVSKHVIT